MKITDVRTRLLRVPLGAARGGSGATEVLVAHVTARADEGAEGTGFTYSLTGGAESAATMVDAVFAGEVTGTDVLDWPRRWHDLWARSHRIGRGVALAALSALDIAVWDLRARAAGLPLYRLLGAQRDRVPVYGSGRATHRMTTAELVSGAEAYVAEGYRAVKLRVGALPPERDLARVRAVREAVGDDVRLMVDANERLDLASAQWLGHALADLGVFWLEEPLPSDDVCGHARLAARCPVPIAAGEHLQGRFEFRDYIAQGAAAVLQPDVPLMGGFSELLRVDVLAETAGVALSPHFLPELHVHAAAAARAGSYVEHFPLIDDLLAETLVPAEGTVAPPDRPGHGIVWDPEALRHFEAGTAAAR